jgi:hypothetical protein
LTIKCFTQKLYGRSTDCRGREEELAHHANKFVDAMAASYESSHSIHVPHTIEKSRRARMLHGENGAVEIVVPSELGLGSKWAPRSRQRWRL